MSNAVALMNQRPSFLPAVANGSQLAAAFNSSFTSPQGQGSNLPKLSLRGRRFAVEIEDTRTEIPQLHLDVVLIGARNAISKTYYMTKYVAGQEPAAPDCSSADGITPDDGVEHPQAASCASCPQNVWGSRITEGGKKGRACADWKRIIVAAANDLNTAYEVRVPAATLKNLSAYAKLLAQNGVPAIAAITRIKFTDAEFPQLDFQFVGYLDEARYQAAQALADSDDVKDAIELDSVPVIHATAPAPAPLKTVAVAAAPEAANNHVETAAPVNVAAFGAADQTAEGINAAPAAAPAPKRTRAAAKPAAPAPAETVAQAAPAAGGLADKLANVLSAWS